MGYETPLYINVPVPSEGRTRQFGIRSTTHEAAKRFYVRFNPEERKLIEEVSRTLEMDPATYIREATFLMSKKIKEHKDAYLKSKGEKNANHEPLRSG